MQKRNSNRRKLTGVLLLDKPIGITSNAALQQVKKIFNAEKAGHTGSLDPLASGMLPICFGNATKFSQFLLDADKLYRVIGKLGQTTSTGDAEGEILETKPVEAITLNNVEKTIAQFRGPIKQKPSMYSALKHNGQPLYKLARQGITVERELRDVTIHKLELLNFKDGTIELEVQCSKGTYIRTLIEDIGAALGCGAHVIYLRRLQVIPFEQKQMVTFENLEQLKNTNDCDKMDALLLPIETMLVNLSEVILSENTAFYLRQGQPVMVPNVPNSGLVKLKGKDGRFIGVGEILPDGMVAPRRL